MGLDIYDVMSGAGEALSIVGKDKMDTKRENKKAELMERLKREEEERAEQRQIRREGREQKLAEAKVTATELMPGEGGAMFEVDKNAFGAEIGRRPANPLKVEEYTRSKEKEKVTLDQIIANTDSARANAEQTRAETAYAPTRQGLERRLTEAQIENYREPNSRAGGRSEREEDPIKAQETSVLLQARSMIGKKKADGTVVTVEDVIKRLRDRGFGNIAKKLLSDDGTGN
jgi:hypothetical protein